ncbi:hypothetical protein ONZ51_g8721 [Trametes cubensis]|uniref:Uncharacterized protein n=1 Tax=Trametes cubensis TaxID=1111947 RepID=A0AAD7TN63_9APHY|nr:hypothetical protein ONZ51_g8721 [Trametes cubensis]
MDAKTNTAATVVATVVPLPAEPDSPSNSSAVTEKVSRWLQAATDGPTPLSTSAAASSVQQQQQQQSPLTESPRPSLTFSTSALTQDEKAAASPAGTVRAKPRKEKPPPIVVAAPGSVRGSPAKKDAVHAAHAVAVAVAVVAPSDSEGSTSDEGQHARGRPGHLQSQLQAQAQSQPHPPQLAHTDSSTSSGSGSRATTLPALSPTRTVSSSGAESTLPTPNDGVVPARRRLDLARLELALVRSEPRGARVGEARA